MIVLQSRAYRQELSKQIPYLIILDVRLPEGNGIDICTEIKSHKTLKELPVILMPAHPDAKKSTECCVDTFVEKPFSIDVFRQQVRQILNKFSPTHAEVM
jgi:two-component system phosphate regulon response regulator PhoB